METIIDIYEERWEALQHQEFTEGRFLKYYLAEDENLLLP